MLEFEYPVWRNIFVKQVNILSHDDPKSQFRKDLEGHQSTRNPENLKCMGQDVKLVSSWRKRFGTPEPHVFRFSIFGGQTHSSLDNTSAIDLRNTALRCGETLQNAMQARDI